MINVSETVSTFIIKVDMKPGLQRRSHTAGSETAVVYFKTLSYCLFGGTEKDRGKP